MINALLQATGFVLAGIIFWRAESVLNMMSKECLLAIRLAFWLIVVGAISMNFAILEGYTPPLTVLIPLSGFTVLLMYERRVGVLFRMQRRLNE